MRYQEFSGSERRTVLCVRSRRVDTFAEEVLQGYQACVLHDAKLACRKAQLGTFDFYLAIDQRSTDAPLYLWRNIRTFDPNTPFVLVVGQPFSQQPAPAFRAEYDAAVIMQSPDAPEVAAVIQRLLSHAQQRSLEARRMEALAVQTDITERLAVLERRVLLSRQSLARAQEHVMRALAIREFLHSGGTKAHFERYWADTFEDALRDSYARRLGTERVDGEPLPSD